MWSRCEVWLTTGAPPPAALRPRLPDAHASPHEKTVRPPQRRQMGSAHVGSAVRQRSLFAVSGGVGQQHAKRRRTKPAPAGCAQAHQSSAAARCPLNPGTAAHWPGLR